MTPAQKAPFLRRAQQEENERQKLKSTAFSRAEEEADSEPAAVGISHAQQKRLNHARLDKSLGQVVNHPIWSHGLALSDHVAALKASYVSMDQAEQSDLKAFQYDSEPTPNPQLPAFRRACLQSGMTCASSKYLTPVKSLVGDLDTMIHYNELQGKPLLLHLQPCGHASSGTWVLIGCVCRRPVVHVGTSMVCVSESRRAFRPPQLWLGFKLEERRPCFTTSHLLFEELPERYSSGRVSGAEQMPVRVEDFSVSVPHQRLSGL